jgi:hypothetical protein
MVAAELYTFWPPMVSVQRPLLWRAAEVREMNVKVEMVERCIGYLL